MLTNTLVVKVVRKLPYNSKHVKKIEKEDLFSKELAQGMGTSGQVSRHRLSVPSLLPEPVGAPYSQGRLSPPLARAARGMACLIWMTWCTCKGCFYSLGCNCDGLLTDYKISRDPAIIGILSNTVIMVIKVLPPPSLLFHFMLCLSECSLAQSDSPALQLT